MNNELYRKVVRPQTDHPTDRGADILVVTEEANGYGVFMLDGYGSELLKWFKPAQRNEAIEYGVVEAENRLIERAA